MTKQVLIETFDFVPSRAVMEDVEVSGGGLLNEDAKPVKRMVLEGVFQRSDTPNLNKRVYPRALWSKLCDESSPMMSRVKARSMVGHLEHPKDGSTDLTQGAILVTDLKLKEDGTVWGRALVYNTPAGRMVQEYVETGTKIGISSRGTGTVDSKGVVQEDYDCQTWDIVFNPSTPGAHPKPTAESANEESTVSKTTEPAVNEGLQSIEQQLLIAGPSYVGEKTGYSGNDLAMVFGRFLSWAIQSGANCKTIDEAWASFVKTYPLVKGAAPTAAGDPKPSEPAKAVAAPANPDPKMTTLPQANGAAAAPKSEAVVEPAAAPAAADKPADAPKPADGRLDEQGVALLAEARAQVATLTESLSKVKAELETSAATVSSLSEDKTSLQAEVEKQSDAVARLESTLAALTAVNVAEQVREAVEVAIKADPRLAAFREVLEAMKTPVAVDARAKKLVDTLHESVNGTKQTTDPKAKTLEERVRTRRTVAEEKNLPASGKLESESDAGVVSESATPARPVTGKVKACAAALKRGILG